MQQRTSSREIPKIIYGNNYWIESQKVFKLERKVAILERQTQLLKSVLQAMTNYPFSILKVPESIQYSLNSILKEFLGKP